MKRAFSIIVLIFAAHFVFAVNQSYYTSLNGKKDGTLRSAITSLVYSHHTTAVGYNWNFANIDIVDNEVLDMYSTCSWTETSDQCGNYSGICGCYNREHTVPQSLFGEKSPQVGDRHHLFLTDGKVNAVRSNYAFGETNNTTTWDAISNGSSALGQLGKASYAYNSSVTVYEPDDQYKGDIARAIMYMAVRYATSNECRAYNSGSGNEYPVTAWSSNEMFSGSLGANYGLSVAAVETFLKWHREDKVSAKEIARNTGVENLQHNRNPFVDYPILVEYLWGKYAGQNFDVANAVGSFETAFVPGVSDGDKASEEEDYYQSLVGKKDAALRSALTYLLYSKHTLFDKYGSSGTANWDFPFDYDENGYVWDIYTKDCNMTKDQGSTSSCCCTGLNREHLVCQSTFGGSSNMDKIPQYCDRHSLFLTDARTNQIRNDQAFGECDAEGATIGNGTNCTECTDHALGRKGKVTTYADLYESTEDIYEPGDEFKGDIARAILYMVVRYAEQQYCRLPDGAQYCAASGGGDVIASLTTPNEHYTTSWKNKGTSTATTIGQMFSTSLDVNYGLSAYGKAILLKWHRQDPVSKKEIDRNAGVEAVQGNRNPFIDHPELVEYLWGELQGQSYVIGDVPVPTTKYTITWSVDGETSTEQVTENEKPSAPSVTNCSESRVFRGWTTSSTVSEEPDVLYTSDDIPAATKAATYYAVYADKETNSGEGAPIGTIMWAEDWTGATTKSSASEDATPSANYGKGTIVYDNAAVTYSQTDNTVYCRNENTGGGTAPELLLTGTKTWTISNIPTGGASELTLTYESNNTNSSVTCSTTEVTVSGSSKAYTIFTGGASAITLSFTSTKNTRLDDISLVVKTAGSASVTTYSNYSTSCSVCVPEEPKTSFASNKVLTTCEGTVNNSLNKGGSEGSVTYSSSNTEVATVDAASGNVTIKTKGKTVITATIAASGCYTETTASYELTVEEKQGTIAFVDPVTVLQETQQTTVSVETNFTGMIIYASSDPTVATINATSGLVSALKPGKTTITANLWANDCYSGASANYELTITALPTYTVTWKANGLIVEEDHIKQGTEFYDLPVDPSDCSEDRVFKGWSTYKNYESASEAPDDLFTSVFAVPVLTSDTTIYAVYADKKEVPEYSTITDSLTCNLINSSSYANWTDKKSYSDAVYAGNTTGGAKYIQMRTDGSTSGIVTTASGGSTVSRIELKWKSNTADNRKIDVYGKLSAYESAGDLYSTSTQGTKLGSIIYGTSTSLDIIGEYPYIGLRSSSNALYVDTIAIIWQTTGSTSSTTYSNYSTRCAFTVLPATDVTSNAFTANWTDAGVETYALDVTTAIEQEGQEERNVLDKDFTVSLDEWSINNVSGYENVWTHNAQYGAYATSYIDKTRNAAESWLLSPEIDLTQVSDAMLTLNHLFRYGTSVYLMIKANGASIWNELSPTNWEAASNWNFVNSKADLSSYSGKKVVIGFKYVGTSEACPTWEIKRITVSGMVDGSTIKYQSIDGYPKEISGTNALVQGLSPSTTYYYTVTPEGGSISNQIEVTTLSGAPTNLESLENDTSVRKVLINGELYIIREGKIYTIQGTRVR